MTTYKVLPKEEVNYHSDQRPHEQSLLQRISAIAFSSTYELGNDLSTMIDRYVEDAVKREVVIELTVRDFKRYLLEKYRNANAFQKCFLSEDNILEAFAELDEFERIDKLL